MKVADFVMKIANCEKRAKQNRFAHRANRVEFWKKSGGMDALYRSIRFPADLVYVFYFAATI